MDLKRITIITGHYGSGKTNFSINLAVNTAKTGKPVTLVDLDIVNPYFRSADFTDYLKANGIRVIAPIYANTNLDNPALPPVINNVFEDKSQTVIIDVGGDDAGASALGRFSKIIIEENNYDLLYVFNAKRPLTKTPEEAAGILNEIEMASHLKANALVNSTNLAGETDYEVIQSSLGFAEKLKNITGLPVLYTAVKKELADDIKKITDNVYPVNVYVKLPWDTQNNSI